VLLCSPQRDQAFLPLKWQLSNHPQAAHHIMEKLSPIQLLQSSSLPMLVQEEMEK